MHPILSALLAPLRAFGDSALLVLAATFWIGVLLTMFFLFGAVFLLVGTALLFLRASDALKAFDAKSERACGAGQAGI